MTKDQALLLKEGFATIGADVCRGLLPRHKLAFGSVFTGVVGVTLFGFLLKHLAAAYGASSRHFFYDRLGILALGIAGTCKEFSELAALFNHLSSAKLADDVGFNVGHLYVLAVKGGFGRF